MRLPAWLTRTKEAVKGMFKEIEIFKEIDWKRKLTSRKFWMAVASFASMMVAAMGGTENTAAQVTALVMAGASVFAYIIGEGLTDSAALGAETEAGKDGAQAQQPGYPSVSGKGESMTEQQMFNAFVEGGLSKTGAAALMGNFMDESRMDPQNLQDSANKKLSMTDRQYTEAVDSGAYKNFVKDAFGYGLAQWTFWSRKQALLEYARALKCSIGDPRMQVAFVLRELQGYKKVLNALKTATDIRAASDIVLTQYEKPADQSEAVKKRRADYAQEIYSRCAGNTGGTEAGGNDLAVLPARRKIVEAATSLEDKKESDNSYKAIIDIYNGHSPLARGYRVKYTDPWCAVFASAVAISVGYTDIIPAECSCAKMIELFQALGRWVEDDAYIPQPGDYIFYDWQDSGEGDNIGWPDHVGIVTMVTGDSFRVIEGNKDNAVGYRDMESDGKYIRGYGIPDYASKA